MLSKDQDEDELEMFGHALFIGHPVNELNFTHKAKQREIPPKLNSHRGI
jgi:hypothetical protein